MSYTGEFNPLPVRPPLRCVARDAGWALVCVLAVALTNSACATLPPPTAHSVDFVRADGSAGSLDELRGQVVVVDVCTSWVAACNLNARVLDEVKVAFAGAPVTVVSLLLDEGEVGTLALSSYVEQLGVQHLVVLAGARVRAGTSSLRDTGYVPRVVVFDAEGRVRLDEAGGVIGVEGLVERIRPLVAEIPKRE